MIISTKIITFSCAFLKYIDVMYMTINSINNEEEVTRFTWLQGFYTLY